MRENLDDSLRYTFGHEGGYTANKNDKGNWLNGQLVGTKYGITGATLAGHRGVRQVSAQDVRNLTLEEAEEIYRKSYWQQSGGDLLPSGLDHVVFDMGVNAGPSTAVKILQRLLGFKGKAVDGIVGGKTVTAAEKWPGGIVDLIEKYSAARLDYYEGLDDWKHFGAGWKKRAAKAEKEGVFLAVAGLEPMPAVSQNADPSPKAIPEPEKVTRDPMAYVQAIPALGGLGFLFDGDGPVQYAMGAVLVIAAIGGVVWLWKRKQEAEA